jgi:hypothetical protein
MRFGEFWPLYLHAHSRRGTRAAHYIATGFGGSMGAVAVAMEEAWLLPTGIGISYVIAVLSHWGIERNQPLILVNPFWGAVADLRMCWLALTGRLPREPARHGVHTEKAAVASPETEPKVLRGSLLGS